jgi:two-component system, NtrC family, sensor kinase
MTRSDSSDQFGDHGSGVDALDEAERRLRLYEGVRRIVSAFSRTASSAFNLPAGLTVCCHEAAGALAVAAATVWIHDRRSHEMVLAATSAEGGAAEGTRVSVQSPGMPAEALRADSPTAVRGPLPPATTTDVAVPLRGRRRALGVLMLEGIENDRTRDPEFLAALAELGQQLSAAIENLLLLEDVLSSRRELVQTFDSLEDLVAICDTRLRLTYANRPLAARLPGPRSSMVDRPLADLLGHEAGRWFESAETGERLGAGESASFEADDPILGGRFSMTLTPLPEGESQTAGAVFVARDVTNRAKLEAERAALAEKLTQAERLAALGQFVAGIAHQLNNPLQAVLGHVELLHRQRRVPDDISRELRAVTREADRAARIVGNLLVFAGGRAAPQRVLRVNALVSSTLSQRGAACRAARIDIVKRFDGGNPRIAANRVLLQQALLNVIVNAEQELTAIGGGRLVVSTRAVTQSRSVRIQIRDTGPGITSDALGRIFEPFYSTKEVGRGTGLGLAIAYGIVRDHGGTITAENHPEGGAVITIELPLVTDSPQPRGRRALPEHPNHG